MRGSAPFFGPGGGSVTCAEEVGDAYQHGARSIAEGETHFEILQMGESDTLAFWTGVQRATVRVDGGEPAPLDLRITEVFHRDGKEWKLVHRYADRLMDASTRG